MPLFFFFFAVKFVLADRDDVSVPCLVSYFEGGECVIVSSFISC